jgi:S1-C subfamily serine protease
MGKNRGILGNIVISIIIMSLLVLGAFVVSGACETHDIEIKEEHVKTEEELVAERELHTRCDSTHESEVKKLSDKVERLEVFMLNTDEDLMDAIDTLMLKPIVEIIPKIKPGVVHIQCPAWQGSGFVISPNHIGTARHVVEGVTSFIITTDGGHVLHATRAISSEKYDFAVICIDDLTCQLEKDREIACNKVKHKVKLHVLKLGSITECQLGQELITIGSPYGKVNFNSVTLGIIAGLDRDYDPLNDSYYGYNDYGWSVAFQSSSPGFPGSSGCAIFTSDGTVVGVLVGGFNSNLIIAMPSDLFIKDIPTIKQMFVQDKYYREEEPDYAAEAWGY